MSYQRRGGRQSRHQSTAALTALLERVRVLRRADDRPLGALPSPIVYGVRRLPLAVERG